MGRACWSSPTDAPLDARDLHRLAARAVFGLARTGSSYSNGSGDFAIAFSTSPEVRSRFNETRRARAHHPADRGDVSAVRGSARSDGGSRLQLPVPGHDRALGERRRGSDPDRSSARAAEALTNDHDDLLGMYGSRRSQRRPGRPRDLRGRCSARGHEVLTTHLLADDVETAESRLTAAEVYRRDLDWLTRCDVLVAEASGSSYGVGFEVGYVLGPRAGQRPARAPALRRRAPRSGVAAHRRELRRRVHDVRVRIDRGADGVCRADMWRSASLLGERRYISPSSNASHARRSAPFSWHTA